MKCSECSFWDKDKYGVHSENFGVCESGKIVNRADKNRTSTDGLSYRGDDYRLFGAAVFTGKDFGCVHFISRG